MQLYSQSESRQANVTVVGLGASEHGDRSGAVRIVLRLGMKATAAVTRRIREQIRGHSTGQT